MQLRHALAILAVALVCMAAPRAEAAVTAAEQSATLNFLNQFTKEYKNQLKGLWVGTDYCRWSGVTCDANDDVHVSLSGRGLKGDLPEPKKREANLVRVVSVDLSNNPGVSGNFEKDWSFLTNLRKMNLSYTSLKGYIPDQWRYMSSLTEVYIRNTAACRNLPSWSAATMPHLRVVDMSYNNFHGTVRGDWASFSRLEKMDISGNNFCGCTPSSWLSAPLLEQAAAQTPMGSPSCAYNSCLQPKYCPKQPNTAGPAPGNAAPSVPATGSPTTASPATGSPTTASPEQPSSPSYDVYTSGVLLNLARSFPGQLSSWTGTDYCSWSGVTCDSNGDVHVDLSNRNLAGTLGGATDSAYGSRSRVVSMDLSRNSAVVGAFPDSWASFKQLRKLDLSYTSLSGVIPSSWNGMVSLEDVAIVSTRACGGLPNWSMASLKRVDMSGNSLRGVLASSWVGMVRLERANLAGNYFCGCTPSSWRGRAVLEAAASTAGNAAALNGFACGFYNRCNSMSYRCS